MPGAVCGSRGVTANNVQWDLLGKKFTPLMTDPQGLPSSQLQLGQRIIAKRSDGTFRGAVVYEFDARGNPTLLLDTSGATKGPIQRTEKYCFAVDSMRTPDGFCFPPAKAIKRPAQRRHKAGVLKRKMRIADIPPSAKALLLL